MSKHGTCVRTVGYDTVGYDTVLPYIDRCAMKPFPSVF